MAAGLSPFAQYAPALYDKGYTPLPILPNAKVPGELSHGEWRPLKAWQKRPITTVCIEIWSKWPDAGISVRLGPSAGVIALDFDHDQDDLHSKIQALLPSSPVVKKGAKGSTHFYRYNGEKSFSWRKNGKTVFEILSGEIDSKGVESCKQTVMPPSRHPEGMQYQYLSLSRLDEILINDLPPLPDNFIEQVNTLFGMSHKDCSTYNLVLPKRIPSIPYGYGKPSIIDITNALRYIDPDCDYPTWISIGMALKSELDDAGLDIWDAWSRPGSKYKAGESYRKWKTFGPGRVNIGTLFYHAKLGGWRKGFAPAPEVNIQGNSKPIELDIDAIRKDLRDDMQRIFIGTRQSMVHVFAHPVGFGKTTAACQIITELIAPAGKKKKPSLAKNILILTKRSEDADTIAAGIVSTPSSSPVILLGGRSSDEESSFYCPEASKIYQSFAMRHHDDCMCGIAESKHPNLCPYKQAEIAWKKVLKKARRKRYPKHCVMIATYKKFLNDSNLILHFDLVVIDESLEHAGLTEEVIIDKTDLEKAQIKVNELYPDKNHPIQKVFEALKVLLKIPIKDKYASQDLRPIWKAVYFGPCFDELKKYKANLARDDSFLFEAELTEKRFLNDLLQALDHKNKVVCLTKGGIIFHRVINATSYLRQMEVISLDATCNKPLLKDIFDNLKFYGNDLPSIPPNVVVKQYWGRKYTKDNLLQGHKGVNGSKNASEVQAILEYELQRMNPDKPLLATFKAIADEERKIFSLPASMNIIHFGGETRASNKYKDSDCMFILGRYMEPPGKTEMRVNALRRSTAMAGDVVQTQRLMNLQALDEQIPYTVEHSHPDPLIQTSLEHFVFSEKVQAIGRLRPFERLDRKLEVVFISGFIVSDLVIHERVNISDFLRGIGYSTGQKLADITAKRNEAEYDKNDAIIKDVQAQSPGLSQRKLAEATGLSRPTIAAHLKQESEKVVNPQF